MMFKRYLNELQIGPIICSQYNGCVIIKVRFSFE